MDGGCIWLELRQNQASLHMGGYSKIGQNCLLIHHMGAVPTVTAMKNTIGDCMVMLCSLRAVSTFSASVTKKISGNYNPGMNESSHGGDSLVGGACFTQ